MTPDVNVLVAAFRSDHPHHALARPWLVAAVAAAGKGGSLMLMPMVAASFVHLVTSPKVFSAPDDVADALDFIGALLGEAGVQMPALTGEWPIFARMCTDFGLSGNDIPDAWLAAAVVNRGDHLVTFDKGFKRLLKPSQFTLLS